VNDLAFPGTGQALTADDGTKSVARFIEQFPVEGPIRLDQDNIRTYPYGAMAAHVLGYVKDTDTLPDNVDDISEVRVESMQKLRYTGKTGAAGVELSYNNVLSGRSGWELWTKTSSGYNQTRLKYSEPGRHRELRHQVGVLSEGDIAALCNQEGVVTRLGQLPPHATHFLRGLYVEVARIEAESLGIVHRRAGAYTQQHVMRVGVFGIYVVQIIGRDERQTQIAGDAHQVVAKPLLNREAVVHELDEVIALPKNVAEVCCGNTRFVVFTGL
jgi:hypothetical protein